MSNIIKNINTKNTSDSEENLTYKEIIHLQLRVPQCTLMKDGYSKTLKKFFFCICDPENQNPVCEYCVKHCHREHWLTKNISELSNDKIEALCTCGDNNHIVQYMETEKDFSFKSECLFMEWSKTSKTYVFYKNYRDNNIICPFCYEKCGYDKNLYVYEKNKEIFKNEKFQCKCKKHKDYSIILEKISEIFNNKDEIFPMILNRTALIKTILLSKISLNNAFFNLEDVYKKIENQILSENNYNLNHIVYNSNIMKGLEKMEIMLNSVKTLFYFYDPKFNISNIIVDLICNISKECGNKNGNKTRYIELFKKYLININHKLIFRSDFEELPNLSESDIFNLSPLQRIFYYQYFDFFSSKEKYKEKNNKKNYIDNLLTLLETLKNDRSKNELSYSILKTIYSEIKILIRLNQLNNEQINNFLKLNDELIYTSVQNKDIDVKIKGIQYAMLNQMIKALLYLSYSYNDNIIIKYLNQSLSLAKIKFFHCDNEISNKIYRNVMHILFYCGEISNNNNNNNNQSYTYINPTSIDFKQTSKPTNFNFIKTINKTEHYKDQIMFIASSITSMTLNYPDSYQNGLGRMEEGKNESYVKFINGQYSQELKRILNFTIEKYQSLEKLYLSYFNFELTNVEFQSSICNIIYETFKALDYSDYILPDYNQNKKEKNIVYTYIEDIEEKNNKFEKQLILSKTPFIYTLLKSLKILIKSTSENEIIQINKEYIELLFKILYFFVDNNPDNSILIFNKDIITNFLGMPCNYNMELYNFLLYTVKIIKLYEVVVHDFTNVINLIKSVYTRNNPKYFDNSQIVEMTNQLILMFKILKTLGRIQCLTNEHMFTKLREFIELILNSSKIVKKVKKLLVSLYDKKRTIGELIDENYNIFDEEEKSFSIINKDNNIINLKNIKIEDKKEGSKSEESSDSNSASNSEESKKSKEKKNNKNNGYSLSKIMICFKEFLKVVNELFNNATAISEAPYLNNIFSKIEVQKILIDLSLELELRVELLRFFRITYIYMKIDPDQIQSYINIIVENTPIISEMNSPDFNFFHDLISVKEKNINMINESYLLTYELKNFKKIISSNDIKFNDKLIYSYVESGIIIPLFVFINKYMSIIYTLDGHHYIKLYEIVLYFLELKKYIVEINLNKKENHQIRPRLSKCPSKFQFDNKKIKFSLMIDNLDDNALNEISKDIEEMKKENFEIFNYRKVYSFFVKHVKTFVRKPESKFLKELFTKKNQLYTEDEIRIKLKQKKETVNSFNAYSEKMFQLIYKYENDKLNFEESSFNKNLDEKNVLYNATYRSIILQPMFFMINNKVLFDKYRFQSLWHLFRLLQYDTGGTQDDIQGIMESENKTVNKVVNINYLCDLFVESYLSIIFSSVNPNSTSTSEDYTIAYMVIKILKYLCEDHNTHFQTLFFNDIKILYEDNPLNIFEFMMCSLNKIVLLAQWETVNFDQVEDNITFFYEIFFVMIEFSIEMIQGTTKRNLNAINSVYGRENENSMFYNFIVGFKNIITNDENDSEIVYSVRLDLINFIVAFLEEKKTPEKLINIIANVFNPLTIFNSIVKTLAKLYIKSAGDEETVKDVRFYKDIEFDNKKCKFFLKKYFEDSEFSQCNEFELANRMYNYVKLLTNFGNKDAKLLIDSINLYNEEDIVQISNRNSQLKDKDDENVMIDQNFTQNYFAVKFFEEITRTVWIKGEENKPQAVLFTLDPTVMFLSQDTKNQFYMTVPRDSASSKLFALMEYCNYFFIEIKHNKKRLKGNWFFKWLNKLDYRILERYIFLITALINLLILMKADNTNMSNTETYNLILPFALIDIVVNLLCLIFWIMARYSLNYSIEKQKYCLQNKITSDEELNFWQFIRIGFVDTMLSKREIVGFIWNIVFSFCGIMKKENMYLFSVQLLIVVNISTTLQNITRAIYLRYQQLLVSLFFLFILMYIFSVIAFYFLSKDYIKELQNNTENTCGSLIYCFLTHLNYGLRTDGGIGEFIDKVSYLRDPSYFLGMFFFQLLFFLIIIVIILAIIGGTIIDTFTELLEKGSQDKYDKKNICFICNGDRNSIEKKGENFEEHITKVHNMWTYVDYLIGLKFVDPQETNAINSFVIEKVQEKKISWFPSFSCEEVNEYEEEHEEEEENESNEVENEFNKIL